MSSRTLGGLRPGCSIVIDPGAPTLHWMPCLRRARDDAGGVTREPHVWFLALTSWRSLYCPPCFATVPHAVIVPKGHTLGRAELLRLAGFEVPADEIVPVSPKDDVASFERAKPIRTYTTRATWLEDFTERAAIFEYLGDLPRSQAEAMARVLVGAAP